ncbi:hypothetical protein [Novosphingopyxis sp.]|uniref:hypothetical protein n=1 Tax=Novosphingopyxis sp. TaxID=2709690 RepID=UPI003B5BFAEE
MTGGGKVWPTGGRTALLLFAFVWLSCGYFGSWAFNPNNTTRLFAAISLVEEGDATIDQFQHLSMDHARFGDHYYTDKAPGMTIMAMPAVWIADKLTGEQSIYFPPSQGDIGFNKYMILRTWLAAFMSSALLVALGTVALFWTGLSLTGNRGAALFGALAYAFATPTWGWATTIFGHASVGALLLIGLAGLRYIAVSPELDESPRDRSVDGAAALAAFALGWALVVEHQAVFAVFAMLVYGLWATRQLSAALRLRLLAVGVVAGLIALAPLAIYNLVAFDTILRVGYEGVVGFEGMDQGVMGLTYPKPDVLWEILFGARRGILWLSPLLVLAPVGLVWMTRREEQRSAAWLCIAGAVIYFLLNAAYIYWDGGNSTGPRHAMPAMAFLGLALTGFWAIARHPAWKLLAAALFAVSAFIGLMIASANVTAYAGEADTLRVEIYARFMDGNIRAVPIQWFDWSWTAAIALYGGIAAIFALLIWLSLRRDAKAAV